MGGAENKSVGFQHSQAQEFVFADLTLHFFLNAPNTDSGL